MAKSEIAVNVRRIHEALAQDEDLDGVDLRVYMFLFARLDFEMYIPVEQGEIAEALNRRKEHISRSIRKLKAKKIVVEATPRVGRIASYVLNSKYGR